MGYSITACRVDLEALKKAFGSRDEKLLAKVKKGCQEQLSDNDESFEEGIAEGAPSLLQAVEEILEGKPKSKKHGFQYGYAIEVLSGTLGTNMFAGECASPEFFDRLPKLIGDKAAKKLLNAERVADGEKKLVLPIPRPADFPGVNAWDAAECRQILEWLKTIDEDDLDEDECEDEALEEIVGWFSAAVKARQGLVTFFY